MGRYKRGTAEAQRQLNAARRDYFGFWMNRLSITRVEMASSIGMRPDYLTHVMSGRRGISPQYAARIMEVIDAKYAARGEATNSRELADALAGMTCPLTAPYKTSAQ